MASFTPHTRRHFFVGGTYKTSSAQPGQFLTSQAYVEHLVPAPPSSSPTKLKPYPIIFICGIGQTATNWLTTPDGRPGWSDYFLAHGYELYLIDAPSRGRSGFVDFQMSESNSDTKEDNTDQFIRFPAELIQDRFTNPRHSKRALKSQAQSITQWPGKGIAGDEAFDQYYSSVVPTLRNTIMNAEQEKNAVISLIDKICKQEVNSSKSVYVPTKSEKVILIAHSAGTLSLWPTVDACTNFIHAVIALEPTGPPFVRSAIYKGGALKYGICDLPLTLDPPGEFVQVEKTIQSQEEGVPSCILQAEDQVRTLVNIKDRLILVVTSEGSYHATYEQYTIDFLRQAGCGQVTHMRLEEHGQRGNGHLFFLEKNSDEVAGLVEKWLEGL